MKRATRWWLIFGVCNVLVVAALAWTSAIVVGLERSELHARAETDYQESLRLAMWRMDSWLSLFFAREAASLTGDSSDLVRLRFEVDSRGEIRSPQGAAVAGPLRPFLRPELLAAAVARADSLVGEKSEPPRQPHDNASWFDLQLAKSSDELDARVACDVPRPPGADLTGRQVVAWLAPPGADEPVLAFVRRVEGADGKKRFQGLVLDWPQLRDRLLFEIRDVFPAARLERATAAPLAAEQRGLGLANVPVVLRAQRRASDTALGITAARTALAIAWLAVAGAMLAAGVTLRKSIDLGERRRRFASSVTHELRTPLTTFQLYTEMLADGLVRTEEQRLVYLQTLKEESRRLTAMVGNVLAHARLEERSGPRPVESLSLMSLIERVRPPLARCAESSGMTLDVEIHGSDAAPLTVDPDAIGQILANLVDNAAKYARGGEPGTISLSASTRNGSLVLTVRDFGPGVPGEQARAIFAPFERGGRDSTDPIPGVGLGLALSRGLARDMGGDLTLDAAPGRGASFRLVVPTRPN